MEHIAKVVYINLDRRQDRRESIESELARMGIQAERFSAVDQSPGMVGCHKSHIAVLKHAQQHDWENVLILEDDFIFLINRDTLENELNAFFGLGIPYDVAMISYTLHQTEEYNHCVGRVKNAGNASGYIVHKRFYQTLIENLETALPLLESTHQHWKYQNDASWKTLQPAAEWFYFKKRFGKQMAGYSDLANCHLDREPGVVSHD
jgi:glycosyl transferase, family 25